MATQSLFRIDLRTVRAEPYRASASPVAIRENVPSPASASMQPLSFTYVIVSDEVRRSVGVVGTTSDNAYFLFENGAWRLWFSVTH